MKRFVFLNYKPSVQSVSQSVSCSHATWPALPGTVIVSAGMVILDKYNASYSTATHQKIQTLSSVSQSVSQLFTSNMAPTSWDSVCVDRNGGFG